MATTSSEIVYLGRDNAIDLQLLSDGRAADLSSVTRMILRDSACTWEVDSSTSPTSIDWAGGDGALTLQLGQEPIPPGVYLCHLFVYDPTNPNGLFWQKVKVSFVNLCAMPVTP